MRLKDVIWATALVLLVGVPAFSQMTENKAIQDTIDKFQMERDTLNDNKASIAAARKDLGDRITTIQAVVNRLGIGATARVRYEKELKKLRRINIPNTGEVNAEIATLGVLIAELQAELP